MEHEIELTQPYSVQKIKYPTTEEEIVTIETKYQSFPTDMTVKEDYAFVKKGVASVSKLISATENHRKFLKKASLEYGRNVDAAAKIIKERFIAVLQPMKDIKLAHETKLEIEKREAEQKEIERKDLIGTQIQEIKDLVSEKISDSSTSLKETIAKLDANPVKKWADEFADVAQAAKTTALEKLRALFEMKVQSENAEEIEKERVQKEMETQQALQVETAKLAAENKKQADELRIAKEKLAREQIAVEKEKIRMERKALFEKAAIEKEKANLQRKIEAEQKTAKEKIEREKKEKEEKIAEGKRQALIAETLQADIKEAVKNLLPFCNQKTAKRLVEKIREDEFKHIKWV